ncbi:MAG: alcohol dehydrogenase catalytic domain-containing protein [Kiritimatiellae bacterium]|nr:alcohol dehydrogenase catalytic domain-containing protein [Kiritimatiellia bacterium]MDD5520808.1 alcohol dehydrogenase catalytic domain-containing protein [Kiritimatiellia bacterium]
MKAVVLTGIKQMKLIETPEPKPQNSRDVLLKIAVVGVCGSDVHYYTTGRIGSQIVKYPYRVGHECSAIVEKIGKDVTRVKPGDRVAVEPAVSCGKCDQCMKNRRNTCRKLQFLGTPGQGEGCLCEYIVMPEENCFPVKQKTSLEQAAIAEPLSIGVYSAKLAMPLKDTRIAILGCGPIGLCVLHPCLLQGVEKIYVTDKIDSRLDAARRAGAHWTGNPDKKNIVSEILAQEPNQLDTVIECCGQQSAMDQAIELLKPGGKLVITGIPEVDRISFPIDIIRRKEICIQNVRRQNECMQAALDLVESGKANIVSMVTHHYDLEHAKEAFDLVAGYNDGVIKAMIKI